jgi:hypothetical protein
MTLRWQCLCIDASDPSALGRWWSELLGWRVTEDDGDEVVLEPPAGSREDGVVPDILFLKVPDTRVVKNRLHIDLRPDDHDREVARAEALGATRIDIGQGDDKTWVVLADPEGNEFCILRAFTPEELAAQEEDEAVA